MVYRIISGQKKLFADVSKILKINGKIGSGANKELILTADDIPSSSGTGADSVGTVLGSLQDQVNVAGKVDKVNGQSPDGSKNVTIFGSNIQQSGTISESVSTGIERLTTKSKVHAQDEILEWDDNSGIQAVVTLRYDQAAGKMYLEGKPDAASGNKPFVLSEINLSLDSQISYAETHVWNGTAWSPSLPAGVTGPASPIEGPYLVLGFKLADESTNYSFSSLASLITNYVAGNGIDISGSGGTKTVAAARDGSSEYNLSIGGNGIKYATSQMTFAEFNNASGLGDGIYYITDDAE